MWGKRPQWTHIRRSRLKYLVSWALLDAAVIWLAYTAAFEARAATAPLNYARSLPFLLVVTAVLFGSLYLLGVYRRIWSRTSGHDVMVIVRAVALATAVIWAIDVSSGDPRPLPVSVVMLGNVLALFGFVATRYRSRLISGFAWRWKAIWHHQFPSTPTRVLIVGAGEVGQITAWRLKHRAPADSPYRVIGFADDDPAKRGMYVEGCPVLGTCADIPRLVGQHAIDLIVIAIHNISGSDFRRILAHCEETAARIKLIPDMFALLTRRQGVPLLRDVELEDFLGRKPVDRHPAVDLAPVTHKTVLVTGAAGSIGSELCRQLLTYNPVRLILLDNNESGLHDLMTELQTASTRERLAPVLADVTDREVMRDVFAQYRPQVVFHSAAYKHVPMLEYYPKEAIRVNICGTRHVAELARDYGVERFVLVSTDKAVNPTNAMGASKRICELLMHALSQQNGHKTLFTSVRFGNVLGSRGSVVPTFNRQIEAGGPVTVTDRDMTRYFMSISEAANLVIHAACLTQGDDLFMLNMGEEVHIVELAERLIRMRGLRPYVDIEIQFTGARPGEKLHEALHAETETPVPTIHPDIIKLTGHNHGFRPAIFFALLDALVTGHRETGADLTAHLLALANNGTVDQPESLLALARDLPIPQPPKRDEADATAPRAPDAANAQRTDQPPSAPESSVPLRTGTLWQRISARSLTLQQPNPGPAAANLPTAQEGSTMTIPMSSPDITEADIAAVNEVLRTRYLSLGPKLDQFEGAFAAYVGTKHAIGVNSGTSGLHLAMIAAGIGRGDEVITPSFSFISSANCVLYEGGTPVFVDIDPLTSNLYPLALEAAITERTRAIIVVHAFGQPADMDPILDIARQHNLVVIEDACEAIGAEYKGQRAGTLGEAAVFAFYPNKQMTTGEGGMIVTDNDQWADLFRSLRNQGRDVFDAWLSHTRLGYNYRLDEMSAALGLSQLGRIEELLARRARVADWYNERIADIPGLARPYIAPTTTRMSWFVYVIRCSDQVDRNRLMSYLGERGVPSRPYFTPIHQQPFYSRRFASRRRDLFNTERAGESMLALPFSSVMTEEQVDYVCRQLAVAVQQPEVRKAAPAGRVRRLGTEARYARPEVRH